MEFEGYELEAAEGTFELMVREVLNPGKDFFQLVSFDVTTKMGRSGGSLTMATLSLQSADGLHTETAVGNGPVNALDLCLRECLVANYPAIRNVKLTDYKVRVIDSKKGTAAKVRVLIEWSDQKRSWATVGVSDNVIEASWKALVDAIRLEPIRPLPTGWRATPPLPSRRWVTPVVRASTWWRCSTRHSRITWWSARCALVTPGRCWACRRSGTSPRRIGRVR